MMRGRGRKEEEKKHFFERKKGNKRENESQTTPRVTSAPLHWPRPLSYQTPPPGLSLPSIWPLMPPHSHSPPQQACCPPIPSSPPPAPPVTRSSPSAAITPHTFHYQGWGVWRLREMSAGRSDHYRQLFPPHVSYSWPYRKQTFKS